MSKYYESERIITNEIGMIGASAFLFFGMGLIAGYITRHSHGWILGILLILFSIYGFFSSTKKVFKKYHEKENK